MAAANDRITGYDELGRITGSSEVVAGTPYNFLYTYNLAGQVNSMTYPSRRVVATGYDGAGRISSVVGTPTTGPSTTYLSAYWPHGAFQNFTFANQVTRSYTFNKQLQATEITDTLSGSQLLDLQYYYDGLTGSANLNAPSGNDNGRPTQTVENAVRGGPNYTYTQTNHYDGLNRLVLHSPWAWYGPR